MSQTTVYQLALSQIPRIGSVLAKNLLGYCGSPEAVFKEKFQSLQKIPGIGVMTAREVVNFNDFDRMYKEVEFMKKKGIQHYFFTDSKYPYRLKSNLDAPLMLFQRGSHSLNEDRIIGVVGTRLNNHYGRDITQQLIKELTDLNCTIVSGMAYGIDVIAHKACVENALPTVGVLAHGLDRLYPPTHHNLAEKMVQSNGALVTEFMSGTKPDKENFPKRNRIVAGLIDVLVVIQSPIKGGSLITADLAFQYDREVMAFPGRAGDSTTAGCNALIKSNKAHMIENVEDLIKLMNYDIEKRSKTPQRKLLLDLSDEEIGIVNQLKENGSMSIDLLNRNMGLSIGKLAQLLLQLEIQDVVRTLPGKYYTLV